MLRLLAILFALVPGTGLSQPAIDSPVKFAFYSSAWGGTSEESLRSGLRLVVENLTENPIRLLTVEFLPTTEDAHPVLVPIDLDIASNGVAERELPYIDLISAVQCVADTLDDAWKLVEISNYTLNPSVRRLIIEDTSAFRIYQCVSTVNLHWRDATSEEEFQNNGWVLYHFESSAY